MFTVQAPRSQRVNFALVPLSILEETLLCTSSNSVALHITQCLSLYTLSETTRSLTPQLFLRRSVWRHWGCVTPRIIDNMKNSFGEADDLDGFDELKDEDQERVQKAWEEGHVADEDIPDSARKPAGNGEDDEDDEGEKKSKKKSAKAKKDDASAAPTKGTFSLEYATSGRAKCKGKDIQCGGLMLMVILTDTSLHFNRLWW